MITETLLQYLHAMDDGNWAEPKPLTRSGLSKMLSPFGIRTKTIWPRFRTASCKSWRGYFRSQFEKAWGEKRSTQQHAPAISDTWWTLRPISDQTDPTQRSAVRSKRCALPDPERAHRRILILFG
jgi:hypothetical protein